MQYVEAPVCLEFPQCNSVCNLVKYFLVLQNKIAIETREMFSFLPLISNSVTMKYNQYFLFFIWVRFFNIFINIIHIIRVFNKSFKII